MSDHPDDMWIEITSLGDPVPRFLLAVDGREVDIERAKELYVLGRIDAVELESRIEGALMTA